ncbi:hypothetical protein PMS59_03275 [Bifidobacterium longum]|nr:hypothetical protein [Bifidobacterium longum]MDB6812304.1 hypothetical protein [Bifidobacterium longum]MDB6816875.1 hypothetical protein [Bifidobacterium longum]
MAEVFSGGVSVTGVEPGTTTIDIKSTTNPNISKKVPVTVKSRNLLSYGPAEGNGLTATVNTDGSLHVTGTATGQWRGLSWTFPCPVQGTVKLSGTSIAGLSFNIKCLDAKGQQLGDQMNLGNSVMAIPAGTVSLFLNVISTEATPTAKDGDIRVQLESGDTAHEWMKPDVTSLEGGGCEPVNLTPSFASLLPMTSNGVTFASRDGRTVHVKGTATAWAQVGVSVRLDAGTYMLTCDNSNGWNYGCRFLGSDNTSQLGGASVKLEAADYRVNVFVANGKTVDIDLTPRIYRLD